jgi:hypothetical protein
MSVHDAILRALAGVHEKWGRPLQPSPGAGCSAAKSAQAFATLGKKVIARHACSWLNVEGVK